VAPLGYDGFYATENLLIGVTFGAVAALWGFRARSAGQAVGLTFASIVGVGYTGKMLCLAALEMRFPGAIAGLWKFGYFKELTHTLPSLTLLDILGSMLPDVDNVWRVSILIGVLATLALVLGWGSVLALRRARRPQL
jgi:hypothetical protein